MLQFNSVLLRPSMNSWRGGRQGRSATPDSFPSLLYGHHDDTLKEPYVNPIPVRPLFHPWGTVVESDDSIIVRHAQRAVVFKGPGAKHLIPNLIGYLDGLHSKNEVVRNFPPNQRDAVLAALDRLVGHHLVVDLEGVDPDSAHGAAFRTALSLSETLSGSLAISKIIRNLTATSIELISDLDNADSLCNLLSETGFGRVTLHGIDSLDDVKFTCNPTSILVVAPSTPNSTTLNIANERALATRQTWTHILPYDGTFATIGPLYVPNETGCYRCFQIRRRSVLETLAEQRAVDESEQYLKGGLMNEWTSLGQELTAWGIFTHLLSMEALRVDWVPSPLAAHVHTVEWMGRSVRTKRHRLFRVPRCPVCGPLDLGVPQPWFDKSDAIASVEEIVV